MIITSLFIKHNKNEIQELTKFIDIGMYVHTHVYTIYCSHSHTCMHTNGIEKVQAVSGLAKVTDVPSSLGFNSQKLET